MSQWRKWKANSMKERDQRPLIKQSANCYLPSLYTGTIINSLLTWITRFITLFYCTNIYEVMRISEWPVPPYHHQKEGSIKNGQKLTAQLTTEAPTIAVEQLGTALVPSSILASSSRNLYQSVFLKIDSHRSPHNSCPDRCGKEALKESSCWTKTRYTVSYYYINSLDKDDCARFCLEAQDCEKFFSK